MVYESGSLNIVTSCMYCIIYWLYNFCDCNRHGHVIGFTFDYIKFLHRSKLGCDIGYLAEVKYLHKSIGVHGKKIYLRMSDSFIFLKLVQIS